MKKNLIILQDGYKECGSACLLSIIRYYGGNVSITKLVELTKTTKSGTNFYDLGIAANKVGLNYKGYKLDDISKLREINNPVICQLINNNYTHFIVLYQITKDKIIIMDPAKGKRILKIEDFKNLFTGYIMIFEPYQQLPNYISKNFLNKLILEVIIKNKNPILNIFILSVIYTIFSCIYAFYFKIIIDKVINTDYFNLLIIFLIFALILLIKNFSNLLRNTVLIYLNQKLDCSLITNTFSKILSLPYSYFKNKTTGEVISRINDLAYIKNMLNKIIITVLLDLLISLVSGIILYNINKEMFVILLIILLVYILIYLLFKKIIIKFTNINQENNAKINSYLVESISGFETIKGLNIEKNKIDKMNNIYSKSLEDNLLFEKISNLELFLKDLLYDLGYIFIIFIGTKYVMNNTLSLGDLLVFTSLLIYFINPIRNIIDLNKEYFYSRNAIKRANNLFEIESEDLTTRNNLTLTGNIRIKNLDFSFNKRANILKNINLKINSQEKVLILGNSGSGKSTLLKLIYKYYNVGRGMIYINENDISDFSLPLIREKICYISQSETLFTDTIKNNIILDREIEEDKFLNICKITYTDEIIKNTFLGYETLLEENGINISGGQRQRIVLSRALLKKCEIIMIDEGLNEIDINLERKILKNIFNYFKNKTFIIISHRLDNMDLYDKVIKLNNGEISDIIVKEKNCYS